MKEIVAHFDKYSELYKSDVYIPMPPHFLDFSENDVQKFTKYLVDMATWPHTYEAKYLAIIEKLVVHEALPWETAMRALIQFVDPKPLIRMKIVILAVTNYCKDVKIPSRSNKALKSLETTIVDIFKWAINLSELLYVRTEWWYDGEDGFEGDDPCKLALNLAKSMLDQEFTGRIIMNVVKQTIQPTLETLLATIKEGKCRRNYKYPCSFEKKWFSINPYEICRCRQWNSAILQSATEDLLEKYKKMWKVEPYHAPEYNLSPFKLNNTSIKVLTSIYSCYRVLASPEDIASVVNVYAKILNADTSIVLFDMIHACYLIKCEELSDMHLLPKSQRIDFHWHISSFFYKKLPLVFQELSRRHTANFQKPLEEAIRRILKRLSSLINIVDGSWHDNSLQSFMEPLNRMGLLEKPLFDELLKLRYDQMLQRHDLKKIVINRYEGIGMRNTFSTLTNVETRMEEYRDAPTQFSLLMPDENGNGVSFDSLLAFMIATGQALEFTQGLAKRNLVCQKPDTFETIRKKTEDARTRSLQFDLSFLLLTRASVTWPSIPLRTLVNENRQLPDVEFHGAFFQWAIRYMKRVRKRRDTPLVKQEVPEFQHPGNPSNFNLLADPENDKADEFLKLEQIPKLPIVPKNEAMEHLQKLRNRQPFWDDSDKQHDFSKFFHPIPQIGQLLLDQVAARKIEKPMLVRQIVDVLYGLSKLMSLPAALIQWLDCQQDTPARRSLGYALTNALRVMINETSNSSQTVIWAFIQSTFAKTLEEMSEKRSVHAGIACTAFSTARRFCPKIAANEVPESHQLKSAWFYMEKQAWSSPHPLRLVEHCNLAGEYTAWSNTFVNKTIKNGCGDSMKKNLEMIFGFLMLDEYNSIIRIYESLLDYWFNDEAANATDGRFDPPSVMPIVKLTTHIMLLAAWCLEEKLRPVGEEPVMKKAAPIRAPEADDIDSKAKWCFLFDSMLTVTMNRFMQTMRPGLMTPVVCTICHLIRSIAASPDSPAKRILIYKVPPALLHRIAYINPIALPYNVFNIFCDPHKEEHDWEKLRFLCEMRDKTKPSAP